MHPKHLICRNLEVAEINPTLDDSLVAELQQKLNIKKFLWFPIIWLDDCLKNTNSRFSTQRSFSNKSVSKRAIIVL